MFVKDNEYNFLTDVNNVKIIQSSSHEKTCEAHNIIDNASKTVWLSLKGLPQSVTFDLTQIIKKPKPCYQYWGIYCWHAYSTNPKEIEIQCSSDNQSFTSLGHYQLHLKPGTQLFEIEHNETLTQKGMTNYIKIIVHKTFGGNRTYINQLFFFDNFNSMNSARLQISPIKNSNKNEEGEMNMLESCDKKMLITSENERYSSENNDVVLPEPVYDSASGEENNNQYNQQLPIEAREEVVHQQENEVININGSDKEENDINDLVKETESDIHQHSNNHNDNCNNQNEHSKIMTALRHMKRIEKVFRKKQENNSNNTSSTIRLKDRENHPILKEFSTCSRSKFSSNKTSHNNSTTYYNRGNHYMNYSNEKEANQSVDNFKKLDNQLNELNCQLKTMNIDWNIHDSVYSTNRTRATSICNNNTMCYPNILSPIDQTDRNNNKTNEEEGIESRMIRVETKVLGIEKEMNDLKAAMIDLNDVIEKKTMLNSPNKISERDNREEEEQLSGEMMNGNGCQNYDNENDMQYDNNDIENNEEMVDKEALENGKCQLLISHIEINEHIDNKFMNLAEKIETQIYHKYLQPSVRSFEKKVNTTMSQMKQSINHLLLGRNHHRKHKNNTNTSSSSSIPSASLSYTSSRSSRQKHKTKRHKEEESKYETIMIISEKLYSKLLEKQMKLEESSKYFKQMLQKDEENKYNKHT